MSERTVQSLVADQGILGALEGGPLTVGEIAHRLRIEILDAWAERHGYGDIEWGTDAEPFGARLLAFSESRALGRPYLHDDQIRSRLVRLERGGQVERISIEGRRPMLWKLARALVPSSGEEGP